MSYIHEALKKAQVEREIQSPRYEGLITAPGKKFMRVWKRTALWVLSLCLIILLAVLTFSWLSFKERPAPVPTGKIEKPVPRERKVEKTPDTDVQKLFLKAKSLQKSGLLVEAEQWYQKAVAVDPGYVPALNNLGVVYLHGGKFSDAKDFLEKAIRLKPEYVDPYYNLACLFAMTGEQEQGFRYLRKAISMNPQVKEWADRDPDLENLRSMPAFGELIK